MIAGSLLNVLRILVFAAAFHGLWWRALAGDELRIGWLRATNDLALAKQHGTLEAALGKIGVRVIWAGPFASAAPALEALNAGSVDLTVASSTSAVTSLAAGVPIVMFTYQRLGPRAEAILVPGNSPLRTLSDLAGHSVGVNRGGTGDYLLARALASTGAEPGAVRRVFLAPADAAAAFTGGHIDAWAIWDPFLTLALTRLDGRILADGAAIGSKNAVVTVVEQGFAAAHPAWVKTVFDVLVGENAWSLAHADAAGAIWAQVLGLPDALAPTLGRNDAVPTGPLGPAARQEIIGIAAWYQEAGMLPAVPDIASHTLDLSDR